MCLVCPELISVLKEYNIKQHYKSRHKGKYDSLYRELRYIEVKKLQKALTGEQTIFSKVTIKNKAIISASVNVAMLIEKERKQFTDAEFVKKCVLSMFGKSKELSPPLFFHYIIHQHALCANIMPWDSIMKDIVCIINFIRSNGLNHRQFQCFDLN